MSRWLQSGLRRDICVLLASEPRRAQRLKTALEAHYDDRLDPEHFRGALDALERTGHVTSRTEGLADVYDLTDAGRALLDDHYAWLSEHVTSGDENG
jgi:DNA-binding PadR family transcriptional regulator